MLYQCSFNIALNVVGAWPWKKKVLNWYVWSTTNMSGSRVNIPNMEAGN